MPGGAAAAPYHGGTTVMAVSRRRAVLGLTSALALTCPLAAAPSFAATPRAADDPGAAAPVSTDPPNIVVFLTDDQPSGVLDVMPNVQAQIQDEGVTFTHAIVPTPLCSPSRASLLTGKLPNRTSIYGNAAPDGGWQPFHDLGLEQSTLATWLNAAGYRTALVGKYINDYGKLSPPDFVPPGWDRFAGLLQQHGSYYNYAVRMKDGNGVRDVFYGKDPQDYSTNVLASDAVDIVDSTPDSTPLFLMYAPVAPHDPTTPYPDDLGTVPHVRPTQPDYNERDVSDKPGWLRGLPRQPWPSITRQIAREKEALRSVDRGVAQIIDALGPRADNTLFVFMSDNGNLNGSHRLDGKAVAYRRSSQVPLIMRWDGHIVARTTDAHIVSTVDVTSTILDAAGVKQPTDGYSLLATPRRSGAVIEEVARQAPAYCAWRTRRWLYVQYSHHKGRELYDYNNDPYELHNLAYDRRYLATMRSMRADARAACDPTPPGFTW